MVLFYVVGLVATLAVPLLVTRLLKQWMASGRVKPRRVMLLGAATEIEAACYFAAPERALTMRWPRPISR